MLGRIIAFEARYQLRAPLFGVAFALFFLMTFGSVVLDEIQIGAKGNVNVNSPYAILQTVAILNLLANVVIRDDETGFAPIVRATRVGKFDYLVGRFAGAFGVAFLVSCSVPLAIWIGSLMPWLDPDKLGPHRLGHYLYAQVVYAGPSLLVMAAGFFALATLTRSMMWTYVGVVAFLVLYITSRVMLRPTTRCRPWPTRSASARCSRPPATGPPPTAIRCCRP
jgi:ABC-2 type transport system permease protein